MTTEQRNTAKRLAYGVLYGMGPARLGQQLGIRDVTAAEQLHRGFLDSLPALRDWLEGVRKGLGRHNTHVEVGGCTAWCLWVASHARLLGRTECCGG